MGRIPLPRLTASRLPLVFIAHVCAAKEEDINLCQRDKLPRSFISRVTLSLQVYGGPDAIQESGQRAHICIIFTFTFANPLDLAKKLQDG